MPDRPSQKYVDHPAPSIGLMVLLTVAIGVLIATIPAMLEAPSPGASPHSLRAMWAVIAFSVAILCFYFWPLYSTYYTVSSEGIQIRYGPWTRQYPWSDFTAAYWQKGLFITRFGWPSVTPCVRLSDGVLLKRRTRRLGLYLTPNDSRAFLRRVAEFAPELTADLIL
jgi:hypothetical protein